MTRLDAIEALLGLVLITAGVAMVSIAAAFVTAGDVLLTFAVIGPRLSTRHGGS